MDSVTFGSDAMGVCEYVVYNNQPWGTHNNQQRTYISDGIVMGRGVEYRYKLIQQYTVLRIGRHLFSRGEYITFAKKGRDCWQSEGRRVNMFEVGF